MNMSCMNYFTSAISVTQAPPCYAPNPLPLPPPISKIPQQGGHFQQKIYQKHHRREVKFIFIKNTIVGRPILFFSSLFLKILIFDFFCGVFAENSAFSVKKVEVPLSRKSKQWGEPLTQIKFSCRPPLLPKMSSFRRAQHSKIGNFKKSEKKIKIGLPTMVFLIKINLASLLLCF